MADKHDNGLRVDRWLWFARFYKTRMLASAAVQAGHVRINGERARAGNRVVPGDTVELVKDQLPYKLSILSLPARRGPATAARDCYVEDSATQQQRREAIAQIKENIRVGSFVSGVAGSRTDACCRQRRAG
jgi:ribosome-associated heat shock protein Hsp15